MNAGRELSCLDGTLRKSRSIAGPYDEQGFALLTVVLALAVLSVIALALVSQALSSARAEAHVWEGTRADALAEAAIVRAALALSDARPSARWPVDGRDIDFTFDDVRMTVRIEDELGKIDLNTAGGAVIEGLFRAAGTRDEEAAALTAAVLDWRNEKGAGLPHDPSQKLAVRPRHRAFQSLDELRLVPGMTLALYRTIAPAATVYSQRPAIDPNTASALALQAARRLDAAGAQAVLVDRAQASRGDAPPGALAVNIPLAGRAFTVRVTIPLGTRTYTRQAVLRLTGDPAQPYWMLDWRKE